MQSQEEVNILIVDDVALNIKIAMNMLRNEFYTIHSVNSGLECIEKINERTYDLILLDIMMPEIDGYETCIRVKKINPDIPIIMLTGLSDNESLQRSFDSGAIDYIRKPFNRVELLSRIKNILSITKAEKQMKEYLILIESDLKMAEKVQQFLLPDWLISNENFSISSKYIPSQNVSGDLFEVIKLSESQTLVYVGDISGHGVQAGLLMTAVKSIIRMLIEKMEQTFKPFELINEIHKFVTNKLFVNNYMTFLLGIIDHDTNQFEFFNAGHPPIIKYNTISSVCEAIEFKGSIPIGWGKNTFIYEEEDSNILHLTHDDIVLFYTDGIYECSTADGDMLGIESLIEIISQIDEKDQISVLPDKLYSKVSEMGYDLTEDDFTCVAVKLNDRRGYKAKTFYKITPSFKEISKVASLCEEVVINTLNDPELAGKIELIINEYANNIFVHGLNKQKTSKIFIELKITDKIELYILDKANEWKFEIKEPKDEETIPESGRGLSMIKLLSEHFEVVRYGDINRATIVLSLQNIMNNE